MGKPLGIIIYQGPSQLDGKPIIAIANGIKISLKIARLVK